ncbi:hypothetical protein PXD56_13610 [Maribacter sp. SA7]|nr:hypothetical protein [Maribacter zhoushanensis]
MANTNNSKIIPIKEIIRPIIAKVLGLLKIPINDSIRPKNQMHQPSIGTQPIINQTIEITKPAVPMLFVSFC